MSYRFLPHVRRGLADRIPEADGLGSTIPSRARFPVTVTLESGQTAGVDLRLYGPGDVIGVDPRGIVRTEPPRFARDVDPDEFAAIEFDAPDFPWMFTPARTGTNDRLRPWLALVVVRKQPGVSVAVGPDHPLPTLNVEAPAVPGDELPDLSESWAWAHAHVVEDAAPASVPDYLDAHPELNVSRLVCPRRLESGKDYIAALVPAFGSGRLAGLGQTVPDATTTTAAWGGSGGVGATVTLPLYFHWEFATGPRGNFEYLARQLEPRPVPDTVGKRPMFIGAAHPALPPLAPDAGGVIELEGALRAPDPGTGPPLGPEHAAYVAKLTEILDAPAAYPVEGASADAEAVAPPLYGGRHVKVETLASSTHTWLNELNTDPRHRSAAGIGTEVVRLNQERYMQSAWEQVGDVLAANALLDRARLMQRVAERVLNRHVRPLSPDVVLSLTASVHVRVASGAHMLAREVTRSTLPTGSLDAGFRRMMSPRSLPLTRAARVANAPGALVNVQVLPQLAKGEHKLDVLTTPPDGLVSSRLLSRFGSSPTGEVGAEIGAVGSAPAALVKQLQGVVNQLETAPVGPKVALRPDLAKTGVLLPRQLATIEAVVAGAGLTGTIASHGATTTVAGLAATVVGAMSTNPEAIGFMLPVGATGIELQLLELARFEPALVARALTGRERVTTVARLEPDSAVTHDDLRAAVAATPPGVFDNVSVGLPTVPVHGLGIGAPSLPGLPELTTVPVRPGGHTLPIDPNRPTHSIDPPVKQPSVVTAFVDAFQGQRTNLEVTATSVIPAPQALDLTATKTTLVAAVDPRRVIEARARMAVRIGAADLRTGLLDSRFHQRQPLDPIMAGPTIDEPLYAALADADPDRFLPGIGDIPDDTITLLETNPRFVEAFLVGANHEMNRELLWRRYPTDRRGTPFHRFWDRVDKAPDIGSIHQFRPSLRLGSNSGADLRGSLVLLVRGQLLRRFPHSVVYAAPALANGKLDPSPAVVEDPIFWGRIAPDVTFVGFDLVREDVERAPGWYFVIAEQPTGPRFGLDVPTGGNTAPPTWTDLHWGHVRVESGDHLSLAGSGLLNSTKPLAPSAPPATFGRNSAHMAAITFQRPFRAVVHTSELLDGVDGIGLASIRPVLSKSVLLRPIALERGGG
ncbi:MAG TPA: hypothetical protein VEX57_18035 [Microlunatus sp.]|nr:hypothetical protein [Microlunatus sp.]